MSTKLPLPPAPPSPTTSIPLFTPPTSRPPSSEEAAKLTPSATGSDVERQASPARAVNARGGLEGEDDVPMNWRTSAAPLPPYVLACVRVTATRELTPTTCPWSLSRAPRSPEPNLNDDDDARPVLPIWFLSVRSLPAHSFVPLVGVFGR